jgi:hypothetical protein
MASLKIKLHQYPNKETQVLCFEINYNEQFPMKTMFKKQKAKSSCNYPKDIHFPVP